MTRSHDVLEAGRKSGSPVATRPQLRRAGLLVWVLPVLAALALATVWLATPSERGINTPSVDVPQPAAASVDSREKPARSEPTPVAAPVTATPADGEVETKSSTVDMVDKVTVTPARPNTLAAIQQAAVIGEWTGFYQGQRQLTVLEGGKATMVVEPEGLAAYLLAPKVTFEILWKVNKDQFEFEIVGGEPLDKVDVVTKMYGKRRSHKILDLQPEKIVLLDEDGVTEYVWNRVPKECR
ncbi:MAG: hypothetical protein JWN70_7224 [Planctomycetaceae bacterium]|nr:hypothetical protein [Planctomycetaceae bacterium]